MTPKMLRLRAESRRLSVSEFQVDGPATANTDDHNCPVDTAERSSFADWRTEFRHGLAPRPDFISIIFVSDFLFTCGQLVQTLLLWQLQVIQKCCVTGIETFTDDYGAKRLRSVQTDRGTIKCDTVVNCAGLYTLWLANHLLCSVYICTKTALYIVQSGWVSLIKSLIT